MLNSFPIAVYWQVPTVLFLLIGFAGQLITGPWLSKTVTVCVAVLIFPLPSVTVQVTVVVPIGKVAGALLVTDATEQLSEVIGVPSEIPVAWHVLFEGVEMFAGAVIVGKVLSTTVTWEAQVAVTLILSVTV